MAKIKKIKMNEVEYDIHAKLADSTDKINTDAGTSTQPVYFENGVPVEISYTINKSVPSDAVFTDTTYNEVTSSAAGLMSAADKTKLDGIATGANKYSLPTATSSVLGGVKVGSNINLSSGTISLTKANVTSALGYTPPTTDTNTTYSAGTGISLSGTTFSNSGVRSIATGSSNGTISVNTNGTSANVAVKGLGSAAYTSSDTYLRKYDLNGINIDSTSGNWTVDISESGHGTVPEVWVNVTQTSGDHFIVQTARKCNNSTDTSRKTDAVWVRDRYTGGSWSKWTRAGGQPKKLWQNTNYASTFAAQSITLDYSTYNILVIVFRRRTDSATAVSVTIPAVHGNNYQSIINLVSGNTTKIQKRDFSLNANNISFGAGWQEGSASGTDNNANIPVEIWGI